MTESEAIKWQKQIEESFKGFHLDIEEKMNDSCDMAINALEKQIEMKKYCDENDCADCPYHNTSRKDNRCMNDFIIDKE